MLLEEGSELDVQQAAALKQFIQEIGGMENALTAIAMFTTFDVPLPGDERFCSGDRRI